MAIDVNLNQNVNLNIPQMANLDSVLQELQNQMKSMADSFMSGLGGSSRDSIGSPREALGRESGRPAGSVKLDSNNLVNKLDELIRVLDKSAKGAARPSGASAEEKAAYQRELVGIREQERAKIREERKEDRIERDEDRSSRSARNWGRALVFGAGAMAVGVAGQYGSLEGSKSQSINAGALNYADFMTQYYNKMADTKQSTISQGSMGAAGLAFAASGFNPIVGGLAFGGAALVNYMTSESTERSKAGTQFGIQRELDAWKLGHAGIGGNLSSTGIKTGFGVLSQTAGQNMSMNPEFAAYSPTYASTMLSGKRDVMSRMGLEQSNQYNKDLTLAAMAMGTGDIGGLNKSVTTLSSITGQSPNNVVKELLDINKQYGGDTAANTAKLVQILETTPMGKEQAANLINKYQYNEPYLNNQIAQSTATPFSLFQKRILMQAAGASPEEMANGSFNASSMAKFTSAQIDAKNGKLGPNAVIAQLMAMSMGQTGENLFAKDIAGVLPGSKGAGPLQENSVMSKMGEMIIEQFKDISIDTQNVTATNVYIGGQMGTPAGTGASSTKPSPTKGQPSTGTGQSSIPEIGHFVHNADGSKSFVKAGQ